MKILFITDNFPPETNAPASRTYEHARRWVAQGAEVTVITCAPNFPHGRVYEGYRNAWRTVEHIDGIRVVRVKSFITSNSGFGLRILDYLSFMFSASFFGLFESRPQVVVGTSPQFFTAVAAWFLSVFKRCPFVFELRDLWPASIVTVGAMRQSFAVRMLEKLELFLYRRASLVVSVTESFKTDLVKRGISEDKILIVRNGVDLSRFRPLEPTAEARAEFGVGDRFVVAYLGTHGMAHALENVLDAAERLSDQTEICFLLVGDGAAKASLVAAARKRGLDNVLFVDSIPKQRMPALWSVCDLALVHLKNDPVFADVIPSKIFEAFGMGKAIVIAQPRGEAVDIVERSDAGIWVPPEDPGALADAIRSLASDPGRLEVLREQAAQAALDHSRDARAAEMLTYLCNIADDEYGN